MDATTASIITGFLNSFGVPFFILGVLIWFTYRSYWPFYVKRTETLDADNKARHVEFMKWQQEIAVTNADMARILDRIEERMTNHEESTVQRVELLKKETLAANVSLKEFIDARHQLLIGTMQAAKGGK